MSRSDTCLACGKAGHTASSCKSPMKSTPIAPHVVEPYDGHEGMVICADCAGAAPVGFRGSGQYRCGSFVPSMAEMPRHCAKFPMKGQPCRTS